MEISKDESSNETKTMDINTDQELSRLNTSEKISFKVPSLFGPRPGKPRPIKKADAISVPAKPETPDSESQCSNDNKIDTEPKIIISVKKNIIKAPKEIPLLPYHEPEWGGRPNYDYRLEVIKSGQIVSTVDLNTLSYVIFGRLECCNVVFEHPSISRYHAILQYRPKIEGSEESGFYAYDLDSTHGTFLNKQKLCPRTYYKMSVGHILKLGYSSRMFILQGPEEDIEPESDLTVTQIKQLAVKREELLRLKQEAEEKINESKNNLSEGISWGFADDAIEEPMGENPFAAMLSDATPNEELYCVDPKKTLRGWFEREGYELEYKVEEKGQAEFSCRVELPIDVSNCQTYFAEATVKGKKKEAVAACALEACRILDRHGVLRQSQQESRRKKKKRWEENDFYDSDEDTFLDRTGTVEMKREKRMRLLKKEETDTYESLLVKLENNEKEVKETQQMIMDFSLNKNREKETVDVQSEGLDPLDAFMVAIKKDNSGKVDKTSVSKLKLKLATLQQEGKRLKKLVELTRPASMPQLKPKEKIKSFSAFIGNQKKEKVPEIVKSIEDDQKLMEEFEEEEEMKEEMKDKTGKEEIPRDNVETTTENEETPKEIQILKDPKDIQETELDGVELNPCDSNVSLKINLENAETISEKQKKRNAERIERRKKSKQVEYDSSNPDYAMWLPPEGQSGDGKTFLNDKFGY